MRNRAFARCSTNAESFAETKPVAVGAGKAGKMEKSDTSFADMPQEEAQKLSDFPPNLNQGSHPTTTHSVLDAQLEALALGHLDLESLIRNSKSTPDANGGTLEAYFSPFKKAGPGSLLGTGTGSSIASASDHEVSSSDIESDSGIENSHAEIHSPEVGVALSKPMKKGVEPYLAVMPHDDLAVVAAAGDANQSDAGSDDKTVSCDESCDGTSCDIRIDSFIECLDEKAGFSLR